MNRTKYTIGIDFGTLSGRALLVRVADGREMGSAVLEYPHAVMDEFLDTGDRRIPLSQDWALEDPADYLAVLRTVIRELFETTGVTAEDIVGVGIDFTSCTVLPVRADGTPLCFEEEFRHTPHAYSILWKHHAAQSYANRLNEIAAERGEPWLSRYGGAISSEWLFPKIWQVLEEAPKVYEAADTFVEGGDWVVWQLTGCHTRNTCTLGYKAIYDGDFPSPDFFKALDPRLETVVQDKLGGRVIPVGSRAGVVSEQGAALTGLKVGTPVAAACADAHVAAPSFGVATAGKMLAIMGTSTCHMLISDVHREVPGICGVVMDGMIPGLWGYEAGQGCVGDHFAWLCENCAPAEYKAEAVERGLPLIRVMIEKCARLKPGETGLLALDWWNGNRSILVDTDLSGMILGMSLNTKSEEILRALIEATAFGTRMIIENYRAHGVPVEEFFASGGIAIKDPFTMQLYADVIGMEVKVAGTRQGPALGSAIYAALAAGSAGGGYDTVEEASAVMSKPPIAVYTPIPENSAVYDRLYAEYKRLHDYFGRGENNVMKHLRSMKAESSR